MLINYQAVGGQQHVAIATGCDVRAVFATMIDARLFEQRLKETQSWCAFRLRSGDHNLRSPELEPEGISSGWGMLDWTPEQRKIAVDELSAKRSDLLTAETSKITQPNARQGRVIAFAPDMSLFDGAAEVASEGFFDGNNIPPWDTWICYVQDEEAEWQNYLLAWVPLAFVELVEFGIDVNPEECLLWADNLDTPSLQSDAIRQLL